jgi:hypothetical protein
MGYTHWLPAPAEEPYLIVIEAKKDNFEEGWGQCLVELITAQKLNHDSQKDSPSLKPYLLEIFNQCYKDGCKLARDSSGLLISHFPEQPIANLDKILDEDWLP